MHPAAPPAVPILGLWSKGFRPFFLLASLYDGMAMPWWVVAWRGAARTPPLWPSPSWHAHEMLFGFATAVVAGFLLTAVSNWTGRETLRGYPLAALSALWIAGRIALAASAWLSPWVVAALDLLFLAGLAVACGRPILATNNRRNIVFLGMLALLWVANLGFYVPALGGPLWALGAGTRLGLGALTLMLSVMGARVIPMFTRNAVGDASVRNAPTWDKVSHVLLVSAVAWDVGWPNAMPGALFSALAGTALLGRTRHWGTRRVGSYPLLWILHMGHAWVGLGLLLRSASILWPRFPATAGTHAITAGGIGLLTLGMMARVSLGHSGRPLIVDRWTTVAFGLLALAVPIRVVAPVVGFVVWPYTISGVLFAAAFMLFFFRFLSIWVRPRADGREG